MRWTLALLCVLAAACGSSDKVTPTQPTPTPTQPSTPVPSVQHWTISGTVWNYTAQGVRQASWGSVFGWIELASGFGSTTGAIGILNGRYEFMVPQNVKRARVARGAGGYQPCAVTLDPTGDTTADLHIVTDLSQLGANLPQPLASMAPTLSGVVYEETPAGRRPVPNAWISLDGLDGLGLLIADTLTDAEGRYVLCNVPHLPGLFLYASAPGFHLLEYWKDLIGRTTLDLELRRQ